MLAIVGADSFLGDEALAQALRGAVGEAGGDAVEAFRGDETLWARVIEAARTPSLFASRRAVVVRAAEALKGDGGEALRYLADPTPGTTLILMAEKVDKRKLPWKALSEAGAVLPADPLKGRALRSYVTDAVKRRRLPLGEPGVAELLERTGSDLRRLQGELDKLEAFAEGRKAPLSAEEVASVLGRGMGQPLYRIGDAMAARRPAEVLERVGQALDEGEPALRILATLYHSLRPLRGAKVLGQGTDAREAVVRRLGVLPFKAGDVLQSARGWTEPELERATALFYEADRRIKSSADARVVLAAAVAEACARTKGGRARLRRRRTGR